MRESVLLDWSEEMAMDRSKASSPPAPAGSMVIGGIVLPDLEEDPAPPVGRAGIGAAVSAAFGASTWTTWVPSLDYAGRGSQMTTGISRSVFS